MDRTSLEARAGPDERHGQALQGQGWLFSERQIHIAGDLSLHKEGSFPVRIRDEIQVLESFS
jgi:hypothetical protein